MKRDAIFSDCGKFRYVLKRQWSYAPGAMCIGLNPSTANAEKDDPTIRILCKHLEALGYGSLWMTNLYALVSSKPESLWDVADNQGDNDKWLQYARRQSEIVIFCWGTFKGIEYRENQVMKMFPEGKVFGFSKQGMPLHPMSLMYSGTKPGSYKLRESLSA